MTEMQTTDPTENVDSLFQQRRAKRKNRRRLWIGLGIILVLAAAGYGVYKWVYVPANVTVSEDEPAMQTATVRQGDLLIYASGTGTLTSGDEVVASFPVSAEIASIDVSVGDYVEAGDVLMTLDPADLQSAYEDAARAFRELTSAAAIAEAKQAITSYETTISSDISLLAWYISDSVYYSEVKVATRQAELAEAQAGGDADAIAEAERLLRNAEALLSEAQASYGEYLWENFTREECEGEGRDRECEDVLYAPTQWKIEDARNTLALDQARLQEAEDYLSLITTGEVPENATGSGISNYVNLKEALQTAEENLNNTELTAPISGLVTAVTGSVGDSSSNAQVTLQDISALYLEVYLDGADWVNIAEGYEADIVFDTLSDNTYTGTVVQVDPFLTSDFGASLLGCLVQIDPDSLAELSRIPLGSSAAVEVISGRAENALLVPVEALREISEDQYGVFLLVDGEPKLQVIQVGVMDVYYAEVISGLSVGDVVTTGIVETE